MLFQDFEPPVRFGFFLQPHRVTRRLEDGGILSGAVGAGYAGVCSQQLFSHLPIRSNLQWTPQRLAWLAVLMAWDEGQTLEARWEHARQAAGQFHGHWRLGRSYTGFVQALVRHSPRLGGALKYRFQRQLQQLAGKFWRRQGWQAFAVDGTRLEAPRTQSNEAVLGCAGRERTGPQVFLTVLWHMGSGLPWDYRLGPGTDSERAHLRAMLADLPERSLVVGDAGFVGYELGQQLVEAGHAFLLRVGGGTTLLRQLGYDPGENQTVVYLWPQKCRHRPPLVLRLIRLERGPETLYLVTNVMDPQELSDEAAATFYHLRWGEEVFYRSYKQTLERRTLKSRTPAACLAEAEWTLLGLWLLGLLSLRRLIAAGHDPLAWSVAQARDVVRRALRNLPCPQPRHRSLDAMLAAAMKDRYRRASTKTARHYPHKKRHTPPGPPKIQTATPAQIQRAAKLPPPKMPIRWAA